MYSVLETLLDITYPVSFLSQYLTNLTSKYIKSIKHIMR